MLTLILSTVGNLDIKIGVIFKGAKYTVGI